MTRSWPLATLLGAGLGVFAVMQFQTSGTDACPLSMLAGSRQAATQTDQKRVTEARHMAQHIETDTDFESKVLQAGKPVLVDFYADWCGPCKFLAPVIEELAGEIGDKADVYKVDVDKLQGVAAKYGIQSIPTVIVFNGGQPASTFVGVQSKEQYVDAINEVAGS
jgi:thioredoxin 1